MNRRKTKTIIRRLYHLTVPIPIQKKINFKQRKKWYKLSQLVGHYYANHKVTKEEKKALSFLHRNRFNLNNYSLLYLSNIVKPYLKRFRNTSVFYDKTLSLPYILHEGKPLFFPHGYDDGTIRRTYAQFLSELDAESPHCYCNNPKELNNRVLFDCGVAEGLFPLTYIDYFKQIVLFECNPDWIEALSATFMPYKEKVHIVNAYVSDIVDNKYVTIDMYVKETNISPTYIKMDIEGYEERAIAGAKKVLTESNNIICSICTYHTPTAETNITNQMESMGFHSSYNPGFMFFFYENNITPPYLRRGVIRYKK